MMNEVLPAKFAKERQGKTFVKDLLCKEECYAIMGACFHVYKDKGCGFLEPVYQECTDIELEHRRIPARAKFPLSLSYRGIILQQKYEPDFICFDKVILELKAVSELTDEHRAQVLNYLNATGYELGLLVNFGYYSGLEWERIVNSKNRPESERSEGLSIQ